MELIAYHGTPTGGFRRFSLTKKGSRTKHNPNEVGFHFTSNPETARAYSEEYKKDYYPLLMEKLGYVPEASKAPPNAMTYKVKLTMNRPLRVAQSKMINADLIRQAHQEGYDSVVASHGDGTEYVVFQPKQIKILNPPAYTRIKRVTSKSPRITPRFQKLR